MSHNAESEWAFLVLCGPQIVGATKLCKRMIRLAEYENGNNRSIKTNSV